MTFGRLVLRNLFYHWRGNSAVFLGVVVGTAVLTGALLVGDSLRGSLRDQVVQQLGNVQQVLIANRLIRQEVADELSDKTAPPISPALVLRGAITREGDLDNDGKTSRVVPRAGRVNILGVNERFWHLWPGGDPPLGGAFWQSAKSEVVLNATLARELDVVSGNQVTLHLEKMSAIPRESILAHPAASEVVDDVKLTVRAVLPEDAPGSRFNLNPSPAAPRNAFVPLATIQKELTQSQPNQPSLHLRRPINALLVADDRDLQPSVGNHLTLDDWGLVLRDPTSRAQALFKNLGPNRRGVVLPDKWPRLQDKVFAKHVTNKKGVLDEAALIAYYRKHHNYLSLESRQLFLDDIASSAAKKAARSVLLANAPTLVYLADKIGDGQGRTMHYAVVAALDPTLPTPLGPFLPKGVKGLKDGDMVLVNWKGTPLPPNSPIKEIKLTYYEAEEQDKPRTTNLRLRGWIPLQGAADDPDLTPEFPGITDKASVDDWDAPPSLHYQEKNVTPADKDYWKNYRTTPKAYVNLATGQKLWGSRFGKLTSIRMALRHGDGKEKGPDNWKEANKQFRMELLRNLNPAEGGLAFEPIRARAEAASAGSNDFSQLFLSFSVFIIVAALLLVGLLFRLNLDRRASEIGLLLATGLPRAKIRRLLLTEGGILAAAGAVLGCVGAIGYAWLLLDYLRARWPGGLEKSFLRVQGSALSYLIGYGASFLVSLLSIAWATWGLSRVAPRALLAGETSAAEDLASRGRPARWRLWVGGACLAGALACVVGGNFVSDHEAQASTFFGSGFLLLVAGLIGVWAFLRRKETSPSRHIATLGVRNAGRHPVRSLLTVGLLASAAFLIIAVESFHKAPGADFYDREGGSGGFPLLAESEVPLFQDLQSKEGKDDLEYLMKLARIPPENQAILQGVAFYAFRLRTGDDASCLNLAQPLRPRLLGVRRAFIEQRGGFRFEESLATSSREKTNPWLLLEEKGADNTIPVIGDATTMKWMLKSGLGKTLKYPTANGMVDLRIVGLLQDSIFQSELLMADKHFRRLFPQQGGYNFFLINAPREHAAAVEYVLETALARHGFSVTPTFQRIETYLKVENTYLATFQALGGLGLLLGALGLAVVLLRSVWERRGELALLRALGYRRSALGWLVLAENSFLLALGLALGAVTALVAVAPHVLGGAREVPWLRLLGLLALVLVVGLTAGALAVVATLRAPLVPALRRE